MESPPPLWPKSTSSPLIGIWPPCQFAASLQLSVTPLPVQVAVPAREEVALAASNSTAAISVRPYNLREIAGHKSDEIKMAFSAHVTLSTSGERRIAPHSTAESGSGAEQRRRTNLTQSLSYKARAWM